MPAPDLDPQSPDHDQRIEDVIVNLLKRYPIVSVTMIGIHIRPYSREWKRVFARMLNDGRIVRETAYDGNHSYDRYMLADEAKKNKKLAAVA